MTFSIGDIVMLKEPCKYTSTYKNELNLYTVVERSTNGYILCHIKEVVDFDDVCPVPIDSGNDNNIYFSYVPAASITSADGIIPEKERDTRYYIDSIKEFPLLYKHVKNVLYVHEVQSLIKKFGRRFDSLKIYNY